MNSSFCCHNMVRNVLSSLQVEMARRGYFLALFLLLLHRPRAGGWGFCCKASASINALYVFTDEFIEGAFLGLTLNSLLSPLSSGCITRLL